MWLDGAMNRSLLLGIVRPSSNVHSNIAHLDPIECRIPGRCAGRAGRRRARSPHGSTRGRHGSDRRGRWNTRCQGVAPRGSERSGRGSDPTGACRGKHWSTRAPGDSRGILRRSTSVRASNPSKGSKSGKERSSSHRSCTQGRGVSCTRQAPRRMGPREGHAPLGYDSEPPWAHGCPPALEAGAEELAPEAPLTEGDTWGAVGAIA